ncbi:MAG: ATP-binding protein [Candidatus Magasanikbacteria bacterium]|uniref:NadR/Ttd14 AAA domain-containing protein n=1 Tax=Candidatus Magasanikbacteria bacterium CG10_big_fil_rev_8_21_14_0_10_38_6 TaxID=1974647 RepID=A0A2M6NZZ4_9BACT|nr:ATP-binding protein [Candidatus Magasanikbacteria bacterium]NCS71989.1 ATP-binding protein [Candidatus Magasanikbacteria bacterium]PIR77053.1 MAG: hypothetical protein COU30_04560 [Candidatus Magasanikbacteria bacterium CG10_big_fil_rev_8_21_14_0_10_38_6]
MKIAIIGTHSTGKTTLKNALAKQLQEQGHTVTHLPEFARLCPFPINEQTTVAAQAWILNEQISNEKQTYRPGMFLLCDRSTIDNFAYLYRAAHADEIQMYERLAAQHMKTYHAIFKTTRLDIDPVHDKVRSTDGTFREEIDTIIHNLIEKHSIPCHILPATTDINEHLAFIHQKITATA